MTAAGLRERGHFPFTFVVFRFKMKLSYKKKTPAFFYSAASVHPSRGKHSHGGFPALCLSPCLHSALSERSPLANSPRIGFGALGFVSSFFFAIVSNQFHSRFVVGIKACAAFRSPGCVLCLCVPADATPGWAGWVGAPRVHGSPTCAPGLTPCPGVHSQGCHNIRDLLSQSGPAQLLHVPAGSSSPSGPPIPTGFISQLHVLVSSPSGSISLCRVPPGSQGEVEPQVNLRRVGNGGEERPPAK